MRPFPDVQSARYQVSTEGGEIPRWNPQGGELFYISPGASGPSLVSVPIETESGFTIGDPTVLFESEPDHALRERYDVAPDGQRFLIMKHTAGRTELHVIQNWFEGVKRRVPTGR